ncbi:MAG: GNAT family N-acetyltransferase [Staphylococcus sp.]|nr:GNAT family N-acetyltransferase [Staphylococcus sp.]
MIEIKTLSNVGREKLLDTFLEAFSDYATSFTREQLDSMLRIRGFNPSLSFGAFDGDRLVAFVFNGIGKHRDAPTAYDTGTGTVKAYRGRGLVTEILHHGENILRENGICAYILEVLCDNAPAIGIYRKAGFKTVRQFACYSMDKPSITMPLKSTAGISFTPLDPAHLSEFSGFCDVAPSWQNSFDSISRGKDELECISACIDDEIVGYVVINPSQGDLMQLAVSKPSRRKGIGAALFNKAAATVTAPRLKVINVEDTCDSLVCFLQNQGMKLTVKQFEMSKTFAGI